MQEPNRWETPVTVQVLKADGNHTFKNFSDLQLAYIWIEGLIDNPEVWTLIPFLTAARNLDASFVAHQFRGYCIVAHKDTCEVTVFYGKFEKIE